MMASRDPMTLFRANILDPRGRAPTDNHCLAYSNAGSIVSPSFVPPGSTILLLESNLRLSYRTTTMWVPNPRNPPIDRTA